MADAQTGSIADPQTPAQQTQSTDYTPTSADQTLIKEVNDKFTKWREERKNHEIQWFINAAFYRGQQYVAWDNQHFTLRSTEPPAPPHKKRVPINRIFPKIRARLAKFLRARPQPVVIAASNERKDRLNAVASQLALDYQWRKRRLEIKYRDALLWAKDTGKGFWWFNWDKTAQARIKLTNPVTKQSQVVAAALGDIEIEVGSPFEILVADQSIATVDAQPEIMRIKMRDVEEMRVRYAQFANYIKPAKDSSESFRFERRIAQLTARAEGMTSSDTETGTDADGSNNNLVLVKELFTRPGGKYPQGRYVVVVGDVLVRNEGLPWFSDMENPFPCVEFVDVPNVGQFWGITIIEQLIGPQRQYNFIRNKIDQQLRLMMHPKIFVPKQAMLAKSAFHSGAGEKIEYNWIPGLPAPFAWTPPNVAADAWRMIQTLKEEIEDISQIFPEVEGAVGDAKSGYQTNLLQEASDSVHAPDARAHELTIEAAGWKIRRLMKLGYSVPRLLTVTGSHRQAEVLEFHADQIDENADIVVQTGSGLPQLKSARQQVLLDWYEKGVFGRAGDPETNRKFLSMADVVGMEDAEDTARKDLDLAQMENDEITAGNAIPVPQFFEDHMLHYQTHTDLLKSAEARDWDDETKKALIAHVLLHFKFINPVAAANFAVEYGLQALIGQGADKIPPPPPPTPPPIPGASPGPPGSAPPPPAPYPVPPHGGHLPIHPEPLAPRPAPQPAQTPQAA